MRYAFFLLLVAACAHAEPSLYLTNLGYRRPTVPCSSQIRVVNEIPYRWVSDAEIEAMTAWRRWLDVPVFYTECGQECTTTIHFLEAAGLVDEGGNRARDLFDPIGFDPHRGCYFRARIFIDSDTAYGDTNTLVKSITHALGHAVGIDHSEFRHSIMKSRISETEMVLPDEERQLGLDVLNLAASGGVVP